MLNKNLNKNELLGVGNILFGIGYVVSQSWAIFKGIPGLHSAFTSFGTQAPFAWLSYTVASIFIVVGFLDIFVGIKLFQKNKSENLFDKGVILFIGSILGFGIISAINVLTVILPIYNLTESL